MRRLVVAAATAVTLLAACGSSGKAPALNNPTTTSAATSGAAGPSSTLNATDSTSMFVHTQSAACSTDLDVMLNAVTAYLTLNGGTEVTEAQLVQAGLITAESPMHDVAAGGTVVPSPGGGCAS